jgi:mRNA-degrading endonuclease RelE of RelBE toxin-antitoxin system
MKRLLTPTLVRDYAGAPASVRKAFHKQARLLIENLHRPSLRAKKYDEASDVWQARVNRSWRFYFTIKDDTYIITRLISHPK